MREFLEEMIPFIVMFILLAGIILFGMFWINRQYDFYDKVLDYAIQTNTEVQIK